jgi:hypothetical protein
MANNSRLQLNPEDLDKEYNMLESELESLDLLFNDAKARLDAMSKYPTKSNPVFMASQTANLISIKEKRLNIIKELTNIKKSKMDMELKMFTANNKLEDQSTGVSKEILDIYRLLNKNDKSTLLEETINDNKEELINEPSDEEIDRIFKERLSEDEKEKKDQTKLEQTLPDEYSIVCTKDKTLYIIDEDYNIIDDCNFDTSVINIVKVEDEYAYDEDNNTYEVVEI